MEIIVAKIGGGLYYAVQKEVQVMGGVQVPRIHTVYRAMQSSRPQSKLGWYDPDYTSYSKQDANSGCQHISSICHDVTQGVAEAGSSYRSSTRITLLVVTLATHDALPSLNHHLGKNACEV